MNLLILYLALSVTFLLALAILKTLCNLIETLWKVNKVIFEDAEFLEDEKVTEEVLLKDPDAWKDSEDDSEDWKGV